MSVSKGKNVGIPTIVAFLMHAVPLLENKHYLLLRELSLFKSKFKCVQLYWKLDICSGLRSGANVIKNTAVNYHGNFNPTNSRVKILR